MRTVKDDGSAAPPPRRASSLRLPCLPCCKKSCHVQRTVQLSPPSSFRTFSPPSQDHPSPLEHSLHMPLSHPAYPPLSLWICLFWTFHVNGITYYVVLCVWLLSLSRPQGSSSLWRVSVLHSFLRSDHFPLGFPAVSMVKNLPVA